MFIKHNNLFPYYNYKLTTLTMDLNNYEKTYSNVNKMYKVN